MWWWAKEVCLGHPSIAYMQNLFNCDIDFYYGCCAIMAITLLWLLCYYGYCATMDIANSMSHYILLLCNDGGRQGGRRYLFWLGGLLMLVVRSGCRSTYRRPSLQKGPLLLLLLLLFFH